MKIVDAVLTKNDCYKQNKILIPKGLMLHSVGVNQPKAEVFVNSWNKPGVSKCVHAFIDGVDGTVYQTLPWTTRGWHAGTGTSGKSANNTHIGVEMCEPKGIKYTGGATFTVTDINEATRSATITYYAAVELFAYLCKQYGLRPYQIISHSEGYKEGIASNHGDPVHLWKQLDLGFTMDTFREDVETEMKEDNGRYHTIMDVPEWARPAVQFFMNKKALNGDQNGDLNLSYDMVRMLVIMYRTLGT